MDFYRINGKREDWCLVNLKRVVYVDFDEEREEIVFDSILRIKVDKKDYHAFRKDI